MTGVCPPHSPGPNTAFPQLLGGELLSSLIPDPSETNAFVQGKKNKLLKTKKKTISLIFLVVD